MFHENDVKAYQKITAPASLKDKVLTSDKKYNMTMKRVRSMKHRELYLMAASVALIIGISSFGNWNKSSVSVYTPDKAVASASVGIRNITVSGIPVEVTTNHKRKVTVSEGYLWSFDTESGEIQSGAEAKVLGSKELTWELEPQTGKTYQMNVSGWGEDKSFQLVYNQETETWQLKEE